MEKPCAKKFTQCWSMFLFFFISYSHGCGGFMSPSFQHFYQFTEVCRATSPVSDNSIKVPAQHFSQAEVWTWTVAAHIQKMNLHFMSCEGSKQKTWTSFILFFTSCTASAMMTTSCVYLIPFLNILAPQIQWKVPYQNLICHLLNLLGLALKFIFEFSLPALDNLQPLHLVFKRLPSILHKTEETQKFT